MARYGYNLLKFVILMQVTVLSTRIMFGTTVDGLSMDYYASSCPSAENTVRNMLRRAFPSDMTLAPNLLRMHFHDCFVEGCDGSVLIDSTNATQAEKESPANSNLRGFDVIDSIKTQIECDCHGVVSCADILAMAAREAVSWTGGPRYNIPKGRKDGTRSQVQDTAKLPSPFLNATELIDAFAQRGFSVQELVALSGAHTLGVATCATFKNRLSNFDSINNVDPSLDAGIAASLSRTCRAGDNATTPLDQTENLFDNAYFVALQRNAGVLTSDQTLYTNARTRPFVNAYARNQAMFSYDFAQVMVKVSMLDVKEGDKGEVRLDCREIN